MPRSLWKEILRLLKSPARPARRVLEQNVALRIDVEHRISRFAITSSLPARRLLFVLTPSSGAAELEDERRFERVVVDESVVTSVVPLGDTRRMLRSLCSDPRPPTTDSLRP